jgi:hypothetical protein
MRLGRWILAAVGVLALAAVARVLFLAGVIVWISSGEAGGGSCLGHGAAEELRVAREWARLAPLPAVRTVCDAHAKGNAFTRSFRVVFVAPAAEVQRWVDDSPGLRGTVWPLPARAHTVIAPGGGAQWAEASFEPADGGGVRVEVYTYWS